MSFSEQSLFPLLFSFQFSIEMDQQQITRHFLGLLNIVYSPKSYNVKLMIGVSKIMPLRSDFQNILEVFIYNNLPVIMNPASAQSAVFTDQIVPTAPIKPTTPIRPITPITSAESVNSPALTSLSRPPVISITPQVVLALQTAALNSFSDLGLRPDLQQIAQIFFSNLTTNPLDFTTVSTPTTF